MKITREVRALSCAVVVALLSLGIAWLAAFWIKMMPSSEVASFTEISTSPELVEQGRQFYAMSCSHCHGDDATGDEGPTLHNLSISNARIATTIKMGVKGEMPTFAKKYDDKQITALVSYLRSLP